MPTFYKAKYPHKYYVIYNNKKINFGHQDYEQFKDQTNLKLYKNKDHNDVN